MAHQVNNIARTGVDLQIAARNLARHIEMAPPAAEQPQSPVPTGGAVRRLLRKIKAAVRPFAIRLRAFWNQPIFDRLETIEAGLETIGAELRALRVGGRESSVEVESVRHQLVAIQDRLGQIQAGVSRAEQFSAASARRIAVACGPDELLIRTEVGYVLCAASDPALISVLIEGGELEPGTRQLIQRLLRPGDVFIDVGANIGMHTLAAAHAMQGHGRIIAFEPFEQTARLLSRTVWMNGFGDMVSVHAAAAAAREGAQTLYIGATSGHNSLYELPQAAGAGRTVEVRTQQVDAAIPAGAPVRLIKIDVEGAELDVLAGCGATISGNPDIALIVEFDQAHLRRAGRATADWLAAFERFGLEYRVVDEATGVVETWTTARLERAGTANLFFARSQSPAWELAGAAR